MSYVVLVTGGRSYSNAECVCKTLDGIHEVFNITRLWQGGALGADALAKAWAIDRGIDHKQEDAKWRIYGKMAGRRRNREMLDLAKPDLVVAFPGGPGTAHMREIAEQSGYKVLVV